MTTAQINTQRILQLHPVLQQKAMQLVGLCSQSGFDILITQGLRTWAEQDALYAQGRTRKGRIVTNAKGGQSWHNFGCAFDIVVLDALGKTDWDSAHPQWKKAADLGMSIGLEAGFYWKKFRDLPHFQITGGLTLAEARNIHAVGGIKAVWAEVSRRLGT